MEFRTVLKESLIYCNIYNSFSFVTYLVTTTWEACEFKILWVTECPTFPVYKSVSRKSYPWICFFFSEEFENNKTSAVEELSEPYQGGRLEQTQDSRSYQPELLHWVAGCRTSLSLFSIIWKVKTLTPFAEMLWREMRDHIKVFSTVHTISWFSSSLFWEKRERKSQD